MLQPVAVGNKTLADYTHICGRELIAEIRELAEPLQGDRVVHISEMTSLTGVSERTLQDGFSRFRGKTPGQFARELRLDLVRHALMEQQDNDNVTKVALRFGFTHLGRFSRSYADRFGEYPSETLQREHKR